MKLIIFFVIFICCLTAVGSAQLCTGSLGDAILNVDFGSGANPGSRIAEGQTSYNYTTSRCPKENEYGLLNFTFGCFQDSWHPLIGDHTPSDQDGYYMLVNSAYVKGDLFVQTLRGLCTDTKYEFSAWVKNVVRKTACNGASVDPELRFNIETIGGTVIATYTSGDISKENDATWHQTGTVFSLPVGLSDVVLRITNIAGPGCGNALALDDIQVRPCGPEIRASLISNGQSSIEVCNGTATDFVLTANSALVSNPIYQWQIQNGQAWDNIAGATSKNYVRAKTGTGIYDYRVLIAEADKPFSPQCRIGSNTVRINVLAAPFVQATGYIYGCLDGDVILLASGANRYLWTGPNGFASTEQRPILKKVKYTDAGLYKVTGTTDFGCINSDSTSLKVYPKATASVSGIASICEGSSIALSAGGGSKYYWEPRATLTDETVANPIATPLVDTRYFVRVTNEYGCSDTTSVQVNVWKKPVANAGPDLKTRLGLPQQLKGSAFGTNVSWYWTPTPVAETAHLLTPSINPPQSTVYTLHVVSPYGCGTATDDVLIKVFDKLLIPNAFSPNGDGINDTWYIEPLEFFASSTTEVYNRAGQVVYKSKGYTAPWDGRSNGKPLPVGTYYYVLDMGIPNQPRLTGSVTIIR